MKLRRLAAALDTTGLRWALARCLPARGIVGLNYHRIGNGENSPLDRGLWSASADAFDQQLAFLKQHADVISPADIERALGDPRGRHVLITFDDGYRDNFDCAFAALRRHGLAATFFVSTGFIDAPRLPWWDEIAALVRSTGQERIELPAWLPQAPALVIGRREAVIRDLLRRYKSLGGTQAEAFLADLRHALGPLDPDLGKSLWMDWDMLRTMQAAGMTIGGHTVNHVVLARQTAERQWQEISTCAARIEAELGHPMDCFAYPVGNRDSFDETSKDCLRRLGVRHAFSYHGGFIDRHAEPLALPRMPIEPYVDQPWFRAIIQVPRLYCRSQ